jgi:long-subunit acyl-CoA synthetase (AMP-forming)
MKRLPLSITGVKLLSLSMFMLLFSINSNAQHQQFYSPIMGRWDITITTDNGKQYPSWLEVTLSGNSMLVGRFVASGGSARPVAHVYFNDNKLSFSIPPQWEQETNDLKVEGTLQGDNLTGTMVSPAGKTVNWTAVRAPSLKRTKEPTWG